MMRLIYDNLALLWACVDCSYRLSIGQNGLIILHGRFMGLKVPE